MQRFSIALLDIRNRNKTCITLRVIIVTTTSTAYIVLFINLPVIRKQTLAIFDYSYKIDDFRCITVSVAPKFLDEPLRRLVR